LWADILSTKRFYDDFDTEPNQTMTSNNPQNFKLSTAYSDYPLERKENPDSALESEVNFSSTEYQRKQAFLYCMV
jgi:hypothetical protein